MSVQPRLAATILVLRASPQTPPFQVLMVRRTVKSEFMPDLYVFPGGSVHPLDQTLEANAALHLPSPIDRSHPETLFGTGLRVAAIRELYEEAGVLLASGPRLSQALQQYNDVRQRSNVFEQLITSFSLHLHSHELLTIDHWLTPESMPKRFDTYFFLAHLTTDEQEASPDQAEATSLRWVTPAEAIELNANADFPLALPTYIQLQRLTAYQSIEEAFSSLQEEAQQGISLKCPQVTEVNGDFFVSVAHYPEISWPLGR